MEEKPYLHESRFHLLSLLIPHNTVSLCRYINLSYNIIKFPARPALSTIHWIRADLSTSRCFMRIIREDVTYFLSRTCLIPITSICPRRRDKRCANRKDIATIVMVIEHVSMKADTETYPYCKSKCKRYRSVI